YVDRMVLAALRGGTQAWRRRTMSDTVAPSQLDVSRLPTIVFGHRSLIWWGTLGMMAIEGTMFAIVIVSYFYLRTRTSDWPPGLMPPAIVFGAINTAIFLVSIIPNQVVKKLAEKRKRGAVLLWLIVLAALGLANLVLRVFEF